MFLCHLKGTIVSSTLIGEGGVRGGVFSWLQSEHSPLDVTKSYILIL